MAIDLRKASRCSIVQSPFLGVVLVLASITLAAPVQAQQAAHRTVNVVTSDRDVLNFLRSNRSKTVIVTVGSPTCPYCHIQKAELQKFAAGNSDTSVRILYVGEVGETFELLSKISRQRAVPQTFLMRGSQGKFLGLGVLKKQELEAIIADNTSVR